MFQIFYSESEVEEYFWPSELLLIIWATFIAWWISSLYSDLVTTPSSSDLSSTSGTKRSTAREGKATMVGFFILMTRSENKRCLRVHDEELWVDTQPFMRLGTYWIIFWWWNVIPTLKKGNFAWKIRKIEKTIQIWINFGDNASNPEATSSPSLPLKPQTNVSHNLDHCYPNWVNG